MPVLTVHLVIATAVLVLASIFDLRTRKIPNRLLISAVVVHLVCAKFDGLDHRRGVIALGISLILIATPILGSLVLKNLGMGDVKLLVYIIWSIGEAVNWMAFLLAISLSSFVLIAVLLMGRVSQQRLPFAPFLAVGALFGVFG